MLTSVLLLSLMARQEMTAVHSFDNETGETVTVTKGRVRKELHPDSLSPSYGGGILSKARHGSIRLRGHSFKGDGEGVFNEKTGVRLKLGLLGEIPKWDGSHAWAYQLSGGMTVGDAMLWVYILSDVDNMGEPYVEVDAFVVGEAQGKPVLQKSFIVKGLGGYYNPNSMRIGDRLILQGSEGAIAVLHFGDWKTTFYDVKNTALCESGNVYWQDGVTLKRLDLKNGTWEVLGARVDQELYSAVPLAGDDLLCYASALALVKSGAVALTSNGSSYYIDKDLGIGYLYYLPRSTQGRIGAFLSLRDLSELCPIVRK